MQCRDIIIYMRCGCDTRLYRVEKRRECEPCVAGDGTIGVRRLEIEIKVHGGT
jgi:hypothetical protein